MKINRIGYYLYNTTSSFELPEGFHFLSDLKKVHEIVIPEEYDFILIADANLYEKIDFNYIDSTNFNGDLIHCGLFFTESIERTPLQIASLSWFFLKPLNNSNAVTWIASPDLFLIRKTSWQAKNGLSKYYKAVGPALADFAYRMLRSGGIVEHDSGLLLTQPETAGISQLINYYDEFLFVRRNLNTSTLIAMLSYRMLHSIQFYTILKAFYRVVLLKINEEVAWREKPPSRIFGEKVKSIKEYSVIIPTLNRYAYLSPAIDSLLVQTCPPKEIIVLDQTKPEKRDYGIIKQFDPTIVKIIYSDKQGQCSARISALKTAICEWCLLFDDDSIATPKLAEEHIKLLQNSKYDISTGVSLAPQKKISDLPYDINYYHLADVLDTGNCFLHKDVISQAGNFDMAFDHGMGADHDLGTRIYLNGVGIVFNPYAVRIHYKASSGGLRTYGVWWRFKTTLTDPYPPPTQVYTIQKYYKKKTWKYIYLSFYFKTLRRQNIFQFLLIWILMPIKLTKALKLAKPLSDL